MGFGSVAATAIMLTISLIGATVISYFLIASMFQLKSIETVLTENVVKTSHINIVITNARYIQLLNEIHVNITNIGSESVILGRGCDVILDYVNNLGSKTLEFFEYGEWKPVKAYVENITLTIPEGTSVEMLPGMTVEITVSPSSVMAQNSTYVIIFVLSNGLTSEYIDTA